MSDASGGSASTTARFLVRKLRCPPLELFERHYGTAARVVAVVGQLVIQVVITSLQYVAGGAILSSLMPGVFSFRAGMAVTAVVFVGITLIGGFWAAGLTNVIVIYLGVVLDELHTQPPTRISYILVECGSCFGTIA